MTDENYQGVGDNGVGGSWGTGDSVTAAILTEIEKRVDDELKKFKAALDGNHVLSGLAVSEKGAGADQSVDVASGSCYIADTKYTEGSTVNVALDAAHGTYARWDIITYDASAGNPSKVTGTAGAIPTIPDVPSGDIILALVLRVANDNTVQDADITDKSILVAVNEATIATKGKYCIPEASDNERKKDTNTYSSYSTSYVKLAEFTIDSRYSQSGNFRIKWDMRVYAAGTATAKIYKNGIAHGTGQSTTSTTFVSKSEDLAFTGGDTCEIWGHSSQGSYKVEVKDFGVYCADKLIDTW